MHHFIIGLIMATVGGYLLMQQVQVHGGYWSFGFIGAGYGTSFGITLIPLLFGIAILFYNGKSVAGRFLVGLGAVTILAGIIGNLDVHFRQTSLYNVLIMLALLVGGLGLIARAVMPMGGKSDASDAKSDAH